HNPDHDSFPTRRSSDLLVKEIDRGGDVEALLRTGHVLGGGGDELAARPRRQQAARLGEVERAEIERRDGERRIVALHLAQEASRSEEHTSELQSRSDLV